MKKLALSIIFLQVLCAYASDDANIQEKFADAVRKGNHILVDEYLSSGKVNVNDPIEYFEDLNVPPLIESAENLNVSMMGVLLNHGANPHARDSNENTVLHKLATATNFCADSSIVIPLINYFIHLGVDMTAKNDRGNTALAEAAEWEKSAKVLESLMVNNSTDKKDALSSAIDGCQPKNISMLLLYGASVTKEHKTFVKYDRFFHAPKIFKKQDKCHDLVMNKTKSEYFVKHCFGWFKKNDKGNVFQILKNREKGKKR